MLGCLAVQINAWLLFMARHEVKIISNMRKNTVSLINACGKSPLQADPLFFFHLPPPGCTSAMVVLLLQGHWVDGHSGDDPTQTSPAGDLPARVSSCYHAQHLVVGHDVHPRWPRWVHCLTPNAESPCIVLGASAVTVSKTTISHYASLTHWDLKL